MLQNVTVCLQDGCSRDVSRGTSSAPTSSFRLCPRSSSVLHQHSRHLHLPLADSYTALLFSCLPRDERSKQTDWLLGPSGLIHSYRLQTVLSFSPLLSLSISLSNPETLCYEHFGFRLMLSFCLTVTCCCYRFMFFFFPSLFVWLSPPHCCKIGLKDEVVTSSGLKCTDFCPCIVWCV